MDNLYCNGSSFEFIIRLSVFSSYALILHFLVRSWLRRSVVFFLPCPNREYTGCSDIISAVVYWRSDRHKKQGSLLQLLASKSKKPWSCKKSKIIFHRIGGLIVKTVQHPVH